MPELATGIHRERLADLILIRLLAAGKSFSRAALTALIKKYAGIGNTAAPTTELLDGILEGRRDAGELESKGYRLTEVGRRRALACFGSLAPPDNVKWQTIEGRYLPAVALGVAPQGKKEWEQFGKAEGLRAAIIARHYCLPVPAVLTMHQALTALAWSMLETAHPKAGAFPKSFDRASVLRYLLLPNSPAKVDEALPAEILSARGRSVADLRRALILRWLRKDHGPGNAAERGAPFARSIRDLARATPTGRFGDKVFISHVWKKYQAECASGEALSRKDFDDRLIAAHAAGDLALSRADLVEFMDPSDVAESEIRTPYSTFHFIRIDI